MPVKLWDSTEGVWGPEGQAEVPKASSLYQIFSRSPTLGAHVACLQTAPQIPAPAQRDRALRDPLCLSWREAQPRGHPRPGWPVHSEAGSAPALWESIDVLPFLVKWRSWVSAERDADRQQQAPGLFIELGRRYWIYGTQLSDDKNDLCGQIKTNEAQSQLRRQFRPLIHLPGSLSRPGMLSSSRVGIQSALLDFS